ncbi:hypothetical protein AAKU55_005400 [Oxalobacteraceae bacterium GrIS 1.11]
MKIPEAIIILESLPISVPGWAGAQAGERFLPIYCRNEIVSLDVEMFYKRFNRVSMFHGETSPRMAGCVNLHRRVAGRCQASHLKSLINKIIMRLPPPRRTVSPALAWRLHY